MATIIPFRNSETISWQRQADNYTSEIRSALKELALVSFDDPNALSRVMNAQSNIISLTTNILESKSKNQPHLCRRPYHFYIITPPYISRCMVGAIVVGRLS